MTTAFEVPLSPTPQRQRISLNGTTYILIATWCDPAQCWTLEVDDASGNLIAGGLPLVTGADLLGQLGHLNIGDGGAMIVQSSNDPTLVPSFATLGVTGHLFFVSPNP